MAVPAMLRRYGDLLLALVLAVGWVVELVGYHPANYPLTAAVGVGAALTLSLRRRMPLASFALMLVAFELTVQLTPHYAHDGLFSLVVFMVGLYSLGAHTRGVRAGLALLGVGAGIVAVSTSNDGFTLFFVAFCGLPWGAGLAVRLRLDRVRELEARNLALRQETERAVAEERARIARELHDVVSHAIAVTVLQSRGGEKLVGRDDDAVTQALAAIEQTNTAALADMRRLLALLRSQEPAGAGRDEPAPGLDRIDSLVAGVRASGLPVELAVTGEPLPVPPGLDLSAYRIVQEALTNVLKHGGASARARVTVRFGTDELELEVVNSGAVADGAATGGHGLVGVRERVAVAGGTVEAGPSPDGYAVRARLPYLLPAAAVTP